MKRGMFSLSKQTGTVQQEMVITFNLDWREKGRLDQMSHGGPFKSRSLLSLKHCHAIPSFLTSPISIANYDSQHYPKKFKPETMVTTSPPVLRGCETWWLCRHLKPTWVQTQQGSPADCHYVWTGWDDEDRIGPFLQTDEFTYCCRM
jgi:hypothetical protein